MPVRPCVALLVLTVGCDPADGDGLSPSPLVTATGAPSLHVPMVLTVTADGPEGIARVEYGVDTFDERTPDAPAAAHHVLPVLGLKPDRTYQWRVVVTDSSGVESVSDVGTFITPRPPTSFPKLALTRSEPESTLRYMLASVVDQQPESSGVGIFDRDGQWVWWMTVPRGQIIVTPKLSPDGRSVVWAEYATALDFDRGYAVRVTLDGSERVDTRLPLGHHDLVMRDDGTIAFLAMTFGPLFTDDGPVRIATDQIRVVPEGAIAGDTSEVLFDTFRDFPHPAELTCVHMTEPWQRFGMGESFEWTHANSLVYVAEEDAYYMNQRFTDWILKIDASTGALLWTMNGLHGDFLLPSGEPPYLSATQSRLWSHPHLSDIWPGGAMVFDNGDHGSPPRSRALEVAWDEDRLEVGIVWEMRHPGGGQAAALGDVRRMPDDHVFITWSSLGDVMEVDRDHRVLWAADLPEYTSIGRVVPMDDLY